MAAPGRSTKQPPRPGGRNLGLLCVPAYLAATLVLTWPLARDIRRFVPTVVPLWDSLLQAFLLHWDLRTMFRHPGIVFDAPIFHPEKNTLTYTDHHLGNALLATPVTWFTSNTALPYNALVIFTCVASAWAMYRLVRLLGVGRAGSFLCGLMFAFSPYRYCNMANLNLLHTEFFPLALAFALRYTWKRRARDLFATGITLAVQSYFSWYYTFFLATALALVLIHGLATRRLHARELFAPRWLATAGLTAALVLPGLLPYLHQHARVPGFERTLEMASWWSADVRDYLRINVENALLGRVRPVSGDQPYFPGFVAVALAIVGLRAFLLRAPRDGTPWADDARRRADAGFLLLLGAVGFVLSLGPVLRVSGRPIWHVMPYTALWHIVPGFHSMRAPGRYSVLVLAAVVALAGLGYEAARRELARRGRAAWLFPVTLAAVIALGWSVPWPLIGFPQRDELPPICLWLERQPGDPPVLNLPMPPREQDEGHRDVLRQIYAIYHRKPLVDGASGFVPLPHRRLRQVMQRFPEAETLHEAAAFGTRIIVVHFGDWDPATAARIRAAADASPGLRKMAAFGDDVAYELIARAG